MRDAPQHLAGIAEVGTDLVLPSVLFVETEQFVGQDGKLCLAQAVDARREHRELFLVVERLAVGNHRKRTTHKEEFRAHHAAAGFGAAVTAASAAAMR